MPYIRKMRLGRAIHLAVSSCTTTRFCGRSRGLQVFRSHPRGSRGCTMQDPASEVRRIYLPRTPLNKSFRQLAGNFSYLVAPRTIGAPLFRLLSRLLLVS
jgi:hypothetical protein